MGLFKSYATNTDIEKTGIAFTPDTSTCIMLARAGGANVKFAKVLDTKAQPYRRQIDAGTLDPKIDKKMMAETYAQAVIKNWETLVDDKLVQGIEADPNAAAGTYSHDIDKNGLVPFNTQNVVATLLALPDLFTDIQKEAQRVANYQSKAQEDDAKN